MSARARGDAGLDGFLNLCKPPGKTSHDVVAATRHVLATRRVGHAGTLDPLAEGVLPLALGRATRLLNVLQEADKAYLAEIELGVRTETDDAEGRVLEVRAVPELSRQELLAALAQFRGVIEQVPPAYAAIKIDGQRSYAVARSGQSVTLAARPVTIYALDLLGWERPLLRVQVRCSRGTYIRALARDLGAVLGVGASLRRLVRTRVGRFHLADAIGLEELEQRRQRAVLAPDAVLSDAPAIVLSEGQLAAFRQGRAWSSSGAPGTVSRAYAQDGRFAGLVEGRAGCWHPKLVLVD